MLDLELMSDQEIKWLNDYHAEVWNKVCLGFTYFRKYDFEKASVVEYKNLQITFTVN